MTLIVDVTLLLFSSRKETTFAVGWLHVAPISPFVIVSLTSSLIVADLHLGDLSVAGRREHSHARRVSSRSRGGWY